MLVLKILGNLSCILPEYERSSRIDGRQISSILKDIKEDKGNCYIATMVYGDYELHPNVLLN
jgi:hypothetical protein